MDKQLAEILNSPLIKKLLEKITKLSADKQFFDKVMEVIGNIDFKELLLVQLAVVLFMMILRSYVFTKTKTFWSHLFAEFWTFIIAICLMGFFVPLYVLGAEYIEVIKMVLKII